MKHFKGIFPFDPMVVRMRGIKDMVFKCTNCGMEHKILDWISPYPIDEEWVYAELEYNGRVRISIPYVECDCGAEYIVDIDTVDIDVCEITVWNDLSETVYQERYGAGINIENDE